MCVCLNVCVNVYVCVVHQLYKQPKAGHVSHVRGDAQLFNTGTTAGIER